MLDIIEHNPSLKRFDDAAAAAVDLLTGVAPEKDLHKLTALREAFQSKLADFYREGRQLNIGIIGQVKAGKSSFLNALLFDGQEVLPKAATPKTATLTKMEYAEENAIEIEYYTPEEWDVLEDNALVDSEEDIYASARELVQMARENGLDVPRQLQKGTERVAFSAYGELVSQLNDFVGVNGRYTPLVKSVVLYLHNEQFQGLSIVDTPGLNDPIVSRTVRTAEFMEVCDVVFFLSQSGRFLDETDWRLLSAQLPQKGVKRLLLIASKYDSALRDELRPRKHVITSPFNKKAQAAPVSVAEACRSVREKLRSRACQQVERQQAEMRRREAPEEVVRVLDSCREPVCFSTIAYTMRDKPPQDYAAEEIALLRYLETVPGDVTESLRLLGDLSPVQERLAAIREEKEQILREKSEQFVPTAKAELAGLLERFREETGSRAALLEKNDRAKLLEKKNEVSHRQNEIRAAVSDVFSGCADTMKTEQARGVQDLRSAREEARRAREHTGTRTETRSYTVSASKWYKPWTWGKTETRHSDYQVSYTYLLAGEAAEQLKSFADSAANRIETVFLDALRLDLLRRRLCEAILSAMDLGGEGFDPAYFRLKVNELVDQITFPQIHMDAAPVVNRYLSRFSGEITSSDAMNGLRAALSDGVDELFRELSRQLETQGQEFLGKLRALGKEFETVLLENISSEFDGLMRQLADQEAEIQRLRTYHERLTQARQLL